MLPESVAENPDAVAIQDADPEAIEDAKVDRGETTLWIRPEKIRDVCRLLKRDRGFERLCAVTAVDWYPMEPRFEVVYHLHSIRNNRRLRLKGRLGGEEPEIDSLTSLWPGANWYEREVYDLFGIRFRGHPRMERLMLPEDWEGHPLRKDYPVHGYKYSYKDE